MSEEPTRQQALIWLVNFGCKTETAQLRAILESRGELALRIVDRPAQKSPEAFDSEFESQLFEATPSMIFGVLDREARPNAKAMLQRLARHDSSCPVILIPEEGGSDDILSLLGAGAADFILPPLRASEVLSRMWRWLTPPSKSQRLTQRIKEKLGLSQIVGRNPGFMAEIEKVLLLAKCDASVLVCGETGTGKELVARSIHYLSARSTQPFVPVSCGAIPVDLAESELFGHRQGAFTGASLERRGLVEEACGGTLFLDDVDSLSEAVQTKLLRFLEEKEYRVLGSSRLCKADVRVIAAANRPLLQAVEQGAFRRDLYYRLNVVAINLPPLRQRVEDIPLLTRHFLAKFASAERRPPMLNPACLTKLMLYDWPGNVRELQHVIESASILSPGPILRERDVELPTEKSSQPESFKEAKARFVARFERHYIRKLLLANSGNISQAARAARKNRRAFWELIRKHGIDVVALKNG